MKAARRFLLLVMALSVPGALVPQASAQSRPATSALSPATQGHKRLNPVKGVGTGIVVGGRAPRHNARQGRRPHRYAWWNVIG
jgi:hypothetical protein